MATLYLDEDASVALAGLLRARGHAVTTTRAENRLGRPDPVQLLFAANSGYVFVTHNRDDFGLLHEAWLEWARGWEVQRAHAGIIVLGRVLGKPPEEYAELLDGLLNDPQQVWADTFRRWHRYSGWTQIP
jgi:hypothetical protein